MGLGENQHVIGRRRAMNVAFEVGHPQRQKQTPENPPHVFWLNAVGEFVAAQRFRRVAISSRNAQHVGAMFSARFVEQRKRSHWRRHIDALLLEKLLRSHIGLRLLKSLQHQVFPFQQIVVAGIASVLCESNVFCRAVFDLSAVNACKSPLRESRSTLISARAPQALLADKAAQERDTAKNLHRCCPRL